MAEVERRWKAFENGEIAALDSPEAELQLARKHGLCLKNIPPSGFTVTLRLLAEQWEKQEQINEEVREELDQTAERLGQLEGKIISVDGHYFTIVATGT